ncbi:MAG: HipA N-terminal domain-containing protein [Thaumarchaeota archaeon]|nr:HipA N-terminal domain-containing protein [Nitrososphaerota archaeon]
MKSLRSAVRALREWGLDLSTPQEPRPGSTLYVFVDDRDSSPQVLGTLTKEGEEFVFRYDRAFARSKDAKPISSFPDLTEEYRASRLWPFFAVRLPPLDRKDVQELVEQRQIPKTDVFRLLAELSSKAVTSPYRFSLASP